MNTTYNNYQPKAITRLLRNRTQEQRTLEVLQSRGSSWTPAPALAQISLQYCRAIACLRKQGWDIENRVETVNVVRHGFYRLTSRPVGREVKSSTALLRQTVLTVGQTTSSQQQAEMFSNFASFAKWRDPEETI